jgi:hypothetical protein
MILLTRKQIKAKSITWLRESGDILLRQIKKAERRSMFYQRVLEDTPDNDEAVRHSEVSMPRYQTTAPHYSLDKMTTAELAAHAAEVLAYARKRNLVVLDVFTDTTDDVTLMGFRQRLGRLHIGVSVPEVRLSPPLPEDGWDSDDMMMYAT